MNGTVTGYKDDAQAILRSLAYTADRLHAEHRDHCGDVAGEWMSGYRAGYADALQAVGLGFGIDDFTETDDG